MSYDHFHNVLSEKSNEELIYLVTRRRGLYLPPALQAAEDLLTERGYDPDELARLMEQARLEMAEEAEQEKAKPKARSIFSGIGFPVTLAVLIPLMYIYEDQTWMETALIGAVGFGAGHIANYFYFSAKNKKPQA